MPESIAEKAARQHAAREALAQELDVVYEPTPAERVAAIVECGMCDDDGYRGGQVCDHIDHAPAARRGMELVRQALAKNHGAA